MRIKVITVASHESEGLATLRKSAANHRMDLTVLGLGQGWRGFGSKIILTYEYLKTLTDYTHFIFVDAYDTLFLHPVTAAPDYILFSCEKHKWPDANIEYPMRTGVWTPWKYLNSGSYIAPIKDYLELIEANSVNFADDDQRYFTSLYINSDKIKLDTQCRLFQSYAFLQPGDFTLTPDSLHNNITGTDPAIIHFNGKCLEPKIYAMINYNSLAELQAAWKDTPDSHKEIRDAFDARVNGVEELNAHRTFVENHVFGFGERSFHWLWHLIVKEMPEKFTFLEIGVLKGQTLSLVEMLAKMQGKKATRYGVTPLSTEGDVWESDYESDIRLLHDQFGIEKSYKILKGLSEDPEIIKQAKKLQLDILYIDGGHEERHITNDIVNYAPLVKKGGYMVIDDCCNTFQMPWGFFQGIESVTRVVDALLPPRTANEDWEFIGSVVHNRVYRRK